MIDPVQCTLNRILNRHPYSDTLTRPALNDSVRTVSSGCRNRSVSPTDSAEEPDFLRFLIRVVMAYEFRWAADRYPIAVLHWKMGGITGYQRNFCRQGHLEKGGII